MTWTPSILRIRLDAADHKLLTSLLDELFDNATHLVLASTLAVVLELAHEIPRHIRSGLTDMRRRQRFHLVCLSLDDFSDKFLPPTPSYYRPAGQTEMIDRYDALHLMFAGLLGEPFAWSSIQNGYMLNDVMPIAESRALPVSSGFASKFGLHTEDAFQRWAGDFLGLFCLRNPDRVPTLFSAVSSQDLTDEHFNVLFEERFVVGANLAHQVTAVTTLSPILFGAPTAPYIRVNLNATSAPAGDNTAGAALESLRQVLEQNVTPVTFAPGDFWYIDNLRVVHGRDVFRPRLDGTDRWLRRLYISSAYRYSRSLRSRPDDYVLEPSEAGWR